MRVVGCFIFILICLSSRAQVNDSLLQQVDSVFDRHRVPNFSVGGAAFSTKGDLSDAYNKWSSGMKVGFVFNENKRLTGGVHVVFGSVSSQDASVFDDFDETVALYTNTNFVNFHYLLKVKLIDRKYYQLLVGQGLGVFFFNPKDEFGVELQDQQNTREAQESYSLTSAMFPTCLEARISIAENITLSYTLQWLHVSTDYIDNMSNLGSVEGNDKMVEQTLSLLLPIKRLEH